MVLEGPTPDEFETVIFVEDPTGDQIITIPNVSGTFLTTGNDGAIDAVGTVTSGTWEGTAVADNHVSDDLTISGGTIDSTVIGGSTPASGTFTSVTSTGGVQANGTLSLDDGTTTIGSSELNVLDSVTPGTVTSNKALVVDSNKDISGTRNVTASGTITADDFLGSFSGDGSGITGVAATTVGTLTGDSPLVLEGSTSDPYETTISLVDPTADRTITLPDVSGTVITTENDGSIDAVGTVTSGTWEGTAVGDSFVVNDLTITDGTVNSTVIGGTTPAAGTFTSVTVSYTHLTLPTSDLV